MLIEKVGVTNPSRALPSLACAAFSRINSKTFRALFSSQPSVVRLLHTPSAVSIQSEDRFALTLTLSPRRGNPACPSWVESPNGERFQRAEKVLPLLGGEGWGEGERDFHLHTYGLAIRTTCPQKKALPSDFFCFCKSVTAAAPTLCTSTRCCVFVV